MYYCLNYKIFFSSQVYISVNKMQNRLVAENVIKTPLKGQPYFSINKKLLAYSMQQSLKMKCFNKQSKDLQIKLQGNYTVRNFEFSSKCPWVYVGTSAQWLQIYAVNEQSGQLIEKVATLKGVFEAKQVNDCVVLDCKDGFYRVLPIQLVKSCIQSNKKQIQLQNLNSLYKKTPNSSVLQFPQNENIYIKSSPNSKQCLITVFSLKKTEKYEKVIQIDYIKNPIAIYRDRYFFNLVTASNTNTSNAQIYDIHQSKLIGKVAVQGDMKYARIRQNLLTMIMNVQNTDYYWFCILNPKPDSNSTLITHKIVYQRGRGDFYDFMNMKTTEALNFTDKKKQQALSDMLPQQLDNTTSSVIYVLNKQKQKVQIIKFDHVKIFESPFSQQKMQRTVVTNIVQNKVQEGKKANTQQNDRLRIKLSLQHKSHDGKTLQQTQKKFIQAIIDTKISSMMLKFQQLQQRVERLEKTMKTIYQKIDQNMKSINRQEIRSSVQSLLEQLTPQFQKYFGELFKQVSGVLDQGVSFYNKKLAVEAQIHKQALNQIVNKTFDQTQRIIELSKKEEKISQRTQKNLKDLLQSRDKWQKKTEQFEQQSRQVTFSNTRVTREPPGEGKVFVRADLNLS